MKNRGICAIPDSKYLSRAGGYRRSGWQNVYLDILGYNFQNIYRAGPDGMVGRKIPDVSKVIEFPDVFMVGSEPFNFTIPHDLFPADGEWIFTTVIHPKPDQYHVH